MLVRDWQDSKAVLAQGTEHVTRNVLIALAAMEETWPSSTRTPVMRVDSSQWAVSSRAWKSSPPSKAT
jgi:hypothetical protein